MSYGRSAYKIISARYELAQGRRVTVVAPATEQAREFAESIDPRCGYIGMNDSKPLLGTNQQAYSRDHDSWLTPVVVFDSVRMLRSVDVALLEATTDESLDRRARVCADVLLEVDRYGHGGKPT
jgi:hypothetical protein